MKISKIIELTQTKTVAEVAKEYLTIGEKPARQALKQAGCYSVAGKPGWFFDESENPENFHQSIYYFADQVRKQQEGILKAAANLDSNVAWDDESFTPRKRHSFDLEVRLVKELKIHCVKQDKTLYEAVEEAIRAYLERNKESTL